MDIAEQVLSVIRSVKPIEIEHLDDSIFGSKYGLEPHDLAYIFLLASERLNFSITEEFIDSLEAHNSFRDVIEYIGSHVSLLNNKTSRTASGGANGFMNTDAATRSVN